MCKRKKHQEDFSENAKIYGKIIFKNGPEENKGGGSIENTILSF